MAGERVVRVEIFDPPMCCPTGLCGPVADPALLEIFQALLKIKEEYDGRATVERYILGQQPGAFAKRPEVMRRIREHGMAILPLTLVNGEVVKERAYPTYAELRAWIERG